MRLASDFAVAPRLTESGVELLAFSLEDGHWTVEELASARVEPTVKRSAHLLAFGGDTGERWNAYFYGTATADDSRVVLSALDGSGGQIVDGAWVVALVQRDLDAQDIEWRFVDAEGAVLESGVGVLASEN